MIAEAPTLDNPTDTPKYHTYYGEFSGTPEQVLNQMWRDNNSATGITYPEWWAYQKRLWAGHTSKPIPDTPDEPEAAQKMLDALLDVKALESGARPFTSSRSIRREWSL